MEKTFEIYLQQLNHSDQTIKSYMYHIEIFLALSPGAEKFKYRDILNYMDEKVKTYSNVQTKNSILAAVKKYYDYLIETGTRNDHPCRSLYLKGTNRNRQVIHNDLFTSQELELLMKREDRCPALMLRNHIIISLLIYQALTVGEIINLKVQHIDLDEGLIFVKESRTLAKRHLEIQARQYRLFDRYINYARKDLIDVSTDVFLIGTPGILLSNDNVNYVISSLKYLFPDRNLNPQTIRQSVIANWINEKKIPLEQVQLMAGHKWISTTAKYRQNSVEEEREMINRFHPLGQ